MEFYKESVTSLGEVLSDILVINTQGVSEIYINVAVITNALDLFEIQARPHKDTAYEVLASSSGEYLTPSGKLLGTSRDLTNIPAAGFGSFMLDVKSFESVRLQAASGNAGGSGITVTGGGR